MACAQTGSGKTAAFLLPIINKLMDEQPSCIIGQPYVVIISPTRELAIQIYNEARKFATNTIVKVAIAYGGTAVRHQGEGIKKGCHILVATPGRLLDFVEKTFVTFDSVRYVILDEADRMLDMGFMPSIEKMMNHTTMPDSKQTLMFSATYPEEIQVKASAFLRDYLFVVVGIIGGACNDVEQIIHKVGKFEKRKKLQEILNDGDSSGTIVFVETKRNADYLASLMSETVIPTTSIHGDRLQREREEALRDFKSGKMHVLVATSVAARGLGK
jgi:probable ATP-dependent RNA helicase DDX4